MIYRNNKLSFNTHMISNTLLTPLRLILLNSHSFGNIDLFMNLSQLLALVDTLLIIIKLQN